MVTITLWKVLEVTEHTEQAAIMWHRSWVHMHRRCGPGGYQPVCWTIVNPPDRMLDLV